MIRMHGAIPTHITTDKKREDTESQCEGMMSLICGNLRGGNIVPLDRGVNWHLQPDQKTYREEVFVTPEEMAQIRARMQANLEKNALLSGIAAAASARQIQMRNVTTQDRRSQNQPHDAHCRP